MSTNKLVTLENMFVVVPYLIAVQNEKIALLHRAQTGMLDGFWCTPTGKVECGESPKDTIIREAYEEIGIQVHAVTLAATIAWRTSGIPDATLTWQEIGLFFVAHSWGGQAHNKEPHKHDQLVWVHPDQLPDDTIPVIAYGIKLWQTGQSYGECGERW